MDPADTVSKPKPSISLDAYGEAARTYMRSRTAQTCASFLLRYLDPDMTLLDCGCGEGTITVGLAEFLNSGSVVGIDVATRALESARQLATERRLSNIQFKEGSVYSLSFADDSFDVVYSHAVFEHLTDQAAALREIRRVLKPGGIVAIRALDLGAHIFEPPDARVQRFWDLFARIRTELGGDNHSGRRLRGMLNAGGFQNVMCSASFESFGSDDRLKFYADIYGGVAARHPYSDEWLKRGWITPAEIEDIINAICAWAAQPGAFTAHSSCEVIGWKAEPV